tara:strand:- start:1304 stop:1534 length:231 start_codon:yes stop_codon:yes gene_type:complete
VKRCDTNERQGNAKVPNMAAMGLTDSAILRTPSAIQGLAGRDGFITTAMKSYLTGNCDIIESFTLSSLVSLLQYPV